jgi:uncharacterized protein YdhG (YjbR/CyaY superfamily)
MKKKKSARRPPAIKAKQASRGKSKRRSVTKSAAAPKAAGKMTVDQYFAAVPEPARSALNQVREAIRTVVPAESTEIISYKIPAFKHKKVLVWYAAFANHCSLFPTAAVIEDFQDELKGYSTSKGTIHFPLDKPMPLELIKNLVRARVAQSGEKKRA